MRLAPVVLCASIVALGACNRADDAKTQPAAGEAAAPAKAPAAADFTAPKRKPGLWTQTVTTAGMTQTVRLCTDATTEEKLSVWGGQSTRDQCARQDIRQGPGGSIAFESVCEMGAGGTVTTTGAMTGDFSSAYVVKARSVTTGAAAPQMNGEHDMTMEAKYQGPCPADFRPGDMEVAQGVKFNVVEMSEGKAPAMGSAMGSAAGR